MELDLGNERKNATIRCFFRIFVLPPLGASRLLLPQQLAAAAAAATFPALRLHQVVSNSKCVRACLISIPPPRISRRTSRA